MISLLQATSKLTAVCQTNPFTKSKLLEILKNTKGPSLHSCASVMWEGEEVALMHASTASPLCSRNVAVIPCASQIQWDQGPQAVPVKLLGHTLTPLDSCRAGVPQNCLAFLSAPHCSKSNCLKCSVFPSN